MAAVVISFRLFRSTAPWEWDISNSWCGATFLFAFPVERHHRAAGLSGTRGNVSAALSVPDLSRCLGACLPDTRAWID